MKNIQPSLQQILTSLNGIGCSYDKWEKDGIISPVIGIECEYKRPTTFNDEIRIHVVITEYKKIKLTVSYTMYNTKTDEVVFTGKSHHCFMDAYSRIIILSRQYPEYDKIINDELNKE